MHSLNSAWNLLGLKVHMQLFTFFAPLSVHLIMLSCKGGLISKDIFNLFPSSKNMYLQMSECVHICTWIFFDVSICFIIFSRQNVFSRITAKISKSDSFSTLSNHQLIILNGRKNSWMVMSATHYENRFTKLKSFGIN